MADEALEIVARIGTVLQHDDIVAALHDEAVIAETKALLDELADPDFACTFVAPEYVGPGGRFSYRGPDGFVDGWREWLEAYDSYRVELEELTEGEDGRLLTLGRQTGGPGRSRSPSPPPPYGGFATAGCSRSSFISTRTPHAGLPDSRPDGGLEREIAHLGQFGEPADLDESVGQRARGDARAVALPDLQRPPEAGAQHERGGAGRLVLGDSERRVETARPHPAPALVLPGPAVRRPAGVRRIADGVDLLRRAELDVIELRGPLRPAGDPDLLVVVAHAHLSRGRPQNCNRLALTAQQPCGAHRRMTSERQLGRGRVDPHLGAVGIVDEDRFGEAELCGDSLALGLGNCRPVAEHAQSVATLAAGCDEDLEDVQGWQCLSPRYRIGRNFSIS